MKRFSKRHLAIGVSTAAILLQIPVLGTDVTKGLGAGKHASSGAAGVNAPAIPAIGFVGFLASPRGRVYLRSLPHPMIQALAKRLGESTQTPAPMEAPTAASAGQPDAATTGCSGPAGTRFNLEPRVPPGALPQNEPVVDFLPAAGLNGGDLVVGSANDIRGTFAGLGNSATGYYVHRDGANSNPCAPDFEGGLPSIANRITGEILLGDGDAAIEADPARGAIFIVDTRLGLSASSLGLFRNTSANLNNASVCPSGTHDAAMASNCWPAKTEVNPRADGSLNVFPQLAVDPRPTGSGTGAGDVYVSNTVSTLGAVYTVLTACKNDLSACSSATLVSGSDLSTQSSYVRVRPNIASNATGAITVTYVNSLEGPAPDFRQIYDIKYTTCTPQGAPNPPVCGAPRLIVRETQPIPSNGGGLGGGSLAAANFQITTFPKHDHRQDANGVETYVVWDRCKVQNIQGGDLCPDADIRLAASANNGNTWNFGSVDTGAGDQYFPAIRTDSSNTVNIAYMSAEADPMRHRARVILRQIAPGPATPDATGKALIIAAAAMDPSGDLFFGDAYIGSYIGIAARATPSGNHAYVHYTHTIVNGVYNGAAAPEQNNHLSRFDY